MNRKQCMMRRRRGTAGRTVGTFSSALAFGLWVALANPAAAMDLGDLQIPASRIPVFDPGVIGGIPDTSSWPVVNALSYGATPNDSPSCG